MGCGPSKNINDASVFVTVDPTKDKTNRESSQVTASLPPPVLALQGECVGSANGRNGWDFDALYSREDILGQGEFGVVYRCLRRDGEVFAVKVTKPTAFDGQPDTTINPYDDVEKRCQEIKSLLRLYKKDETTGRLIGHRNILMLSELYWDGFRLGLVTELLGPSLKKWINDQPVFTEGTAKTVAQTLLKAIKYMHSRGVIHRDLKRGNLMFPIGGDAKSIKIVDFGFAAVLMKNETRTEFCGTPGYMAPELFKTRPEPYRHEVDMFSFGSILFQMLSGESPFPSRDLAEAKKRTAELRYTVTEGRWNLVSNPAKDLIRQTLCYKEDRLSARKALDHFWFSDMAGAKSVLRIDTEADEPLPAPSPDKPEQNPASGDGYSRHSGVTQAAPEPRRSWAMVDTDPAAHSNGTGSGGTTGTPRRFVVSPGVLNALQQLGPLFAGALMVEEGVFQADGRPTIVADETVVGPGVKRMTLAGYIAQLPKYTENDCRVLVKRTAELIQILHRAGVAHRYLHPDNIVVDISLNTSVLPSVEVVDLKLKGFRFAQAITPGTMLTGRIGRNVYDWFAFSAPEIDLSFAHDLRVDLWSLGAIAFTLLTAHVPFEGLGDQIAQNKHAGIVAECFTSSPSQAAHAFYRDLLKVSVDQRMATIEEVLESVWMRTPKSRLDGNEMELAQSMLREDWARQDLSRSSTSHHRTDSRSNGGVAIPVSVEVAL